MLDLQGLVDGVVSGAGVPGAGAVMGSSAEILAKGVAGVRKRGESELLRLTDLIHIGSCGKALTATMIGALVDEGVVSWETTVGSAFPHSGYATVTIEQLLRHEAGLPPFEEEEDFIGLPSLPEEPVAHRAAFTEVVLGLAPLDQPGTGFRYSNAGYCVATSIVERITGEAWEDLLLSRVVEPLGLSAGFGWPARTHPAAAWGHMPDAEGDLSPHDPHDDYQLPPSLSPAGDLHMSLLDLAAWLQTNLRGLAGEDTVVTAETMRRIHTSRGPVALGWGVQELGGVAFSGHSGSAGTFYVLAMVVPDHDRFLAVGTNVGYEMAEDATRQIVREFLTHLANGS